MTTDTKFDREAYVSKVQKLLAKAEGAATEEEATVFLSKAQELISRWEIEEAELREAQPAQSIQYDVQCRNVRLSSFAPKQDATAVHCVAQAQGLQTVFHPYGGRGYPASIDVYGTPDDLVRFDMLWASVSAQSVRFMREAEPQNLNRNESRRFRLGFKVGFGVRIGERIKEARDNTIKDNLPVLAGKRDAITKALPPTKHTGVKADAAAAAAGRRAANRASLGTQGVLR